MISPPKASVARCTQESFRPAEVVRKAASGAADKSQSKAVRTGRQTPLAEQVFATFFGTTNKKGPGISAKSLFSKAVLVGGAGFEPATPAV
jgi:hypothetical protein